MVCLIAFSVCLILFGEVPRNLLIFALFWDTVQRVNRHHCDLKAALLSSQHFLIENLLNFLIFSISWKTQNISSKLSSSSELCWFPIIKNWAWWYDKVLTRFPETTEELLLLVNILFIRVVELRWKCVEGEGKSTWNQKNGEYCYCGHT